MCLSRVHVYAPWTRWRQCSIDFNFPTLAFRVDSPVFSTTSKPNLWHMETTSRPIRPTRLLNERRPAKTKRIRPNFHHQRWIESVEMRWVLQFPSLLWWCTSVKGPYVLSLANRNGRAKAQQTWRTPNCTTHILYFLLQCISLKWMLWFVDRRRVERIFRRTQVLH